MSIEFLRIKNFIVAITPHQSDMVDARVIVNAGASKDEVWGTAHCLEHLFFKGSKRHTYEELNRQAARLGAINAHTSEFHTAYLLQFLPNDIEEASKLLMELVFEPAFPKEEFDKEIGVITEECQTRLDDPMSFFFEKMRWHISGDEFGHPIVGTMESIHALTIEKLHSFVDSYYTPANMLISFVGPLMPSVVRKTLKDCLPDVPDGELEIEKKSPPKLDRFNLHHPSKQAIFALVSEGVSLQGEMERNFIPDIFCNGLGGGMHSLLFHSIREKLGLCYNVGAYHSSNASGGELVVYSMLDEKNIDLAIEEANKIIIKVKKGGFDDDLLDIAKRNYLFNFAKQRLTPSGIANYLEAYFWLNPQNINGYLSFEERSKRVNSIKNRDIIEFANFIFDDKKPVGNIQMTQGTEEEAVVVDNSRQEFDIIWD